MFSQLFCSVAEEIINQFGDKGRDAIIQAVKKYGEERGRRIAKLVKSLGKELSLKNFFIYIDLDIRKTAKYRPKIVDGKAVVVIRECVFCNGCKEWNKLEYGKIYCEHIDTAVLKGYNPDLVIEVPSILTRGDDRCVLRYIVKKKE
jgi:hypothetical protein